MRNSRGGKLIDKNFIGNMLLVGGVVLSLLIFCGFMGVSELLNREVFAQGVFVDGINVSDLTLSQGMETVQKSAEQRLAQIRATLQYKDDIQEFGAEELGISINTEEAVNQSFHYNKSPDDSPEERFNKTAFLSRGMDFQSERIIDESRLRRTIERYAAQFMIPPADAVAVFDKTTSSFSFMEAQPGVEVDTDQLFNDMLTALAERDNISIQVTDKVIPAAVTASELRQNTALIASYETIAENNENRNTNIRLISTALDGMEIKPGETLSVNEVVGQRTLEKGYKPASAISDGILVDQVGGGICQLAGTLYNAALLADLEIVERVRHTWPSVYLPVGQDSTLNWNDKDLKIKNNRSYSVLISTEFKDQKLTVKLYGPPLPEGVSIKIENKILKEIKPGATEVLYSNKLPVGSSQTVRKARTGYHVEVYRVYYQDGVEIKRTLVSKDRYPALQKIVLKGRSVTQDK